MDRIEKLLFAALKLWFSLVGLTIAVFMMKASIAMFVAQL